MRLFGNVAPRPDVILTTFMRRRWCGRCLAVSLALVLWPLLAPAQGMGDVGGPSVTMAPAATAEVTRGKAGTVDLAFRVKPGFHINSSHPNSEYLIPTTLKLDPPTDIAVGKVTYPPGRDLSFSFAPDEKLNVYSGDFRVAVTVHPLHSVPPGLYNIRGQLRYQACDDRACYPPKQLAVEFPVRVVRPAPPHAHGNRQSPHIHD
jgi:cytochrome c biogenesis DsbD-like protein